MIQTMLIDDEQPARDRLRNMLAQFDDIEVIDEARDGEDAIHKIERHHPDLIFLDIQMPGKSGLEVAASLKPPRPRIIFCTAFDQYAIEAFEQHATDYLLKPVSRKRLAKALDRVKLAVKEQRAQAREVADASSAQARLMPQSLPPMRGLELAGACRAARGVGGDYYDFLPLGERELGIALGDVSGKGMFAGLLAANLQARVQSIASRFGSNIKELMGEINRLMYSCIDSNRYATLFFGLYDDNTRSLTYVNAGHNPPLLFRPKPSDPSDRQTYSVRRLEATGTVVGMLPNALYEQRTVALEPGDILIAFTDGLTEARNAAAEEFGETRVESAVAQFAGSAAVPLCGHVLDEVRKFSGGTPAHDDLTLIVAKVV
jgi:sigma-B regulation protein RsbU (phosphoserine phosphatase)